MARHRSTFVVALLALFAAGPAALSSQQPAGPPSNSNPVVAPDGRSIAFVSNRDGNQDLFVVPSNGGRERQLTRTPDAEGRPEWSADGKHLLYGVTAGETTQLYALDVATGDAAAIGSVPARGVVVSSDRKRIAYMTGTWQASRLTVANLDGTNARHLTTTEQTGVAWNARFSPDGEWIAFTGQDQNRQLHVFVVGVDGKGLQQLTRFTPEEGRAQVPAWSADGRQIAFQLSRKGSSDVWRIGADGTRAALIIPPVAAVLDEVPAWFPGGDRVAFQSTRSGRMEIWTAGVDGSDPQQITGIAP